MKDPALGRTRAERALGEGHEMDYSVCKVENCTCICETR